MEIIDVCNDCSEITASFGLVGHCPVCGAPIWVELDTNPPKTVYGCDCKEKMLVWYSFPKYETPKWDPRPKFGERQ